jgi:phage replication-related protein YjqB (UPF0714/DUF867 family)
VVYLHSMSGRPGAPEAFAGYERLAQVTREDLDYRRELRRTYSGVAHIAVHGGGIEVGTAEAADAVAAANGQDYYAFVGLRSSGNNELHITSVHFDEPQCVELQRASRRTVSYHGCAGGEPIIHLGGADPELKWHVGHALTEAGFAVDWHTTEDLDGTDQRNICNRNASNAGLQLELSAGLRTSFFPGGRTGRVTRESGQRTDLFRHFVITLASATSTPIPANRPTEH